jgi:hypothetical protein
VFVVFRNEREGVVRNPWDAVGTKEGATKEIGAIVEDLDITLL